MSIEQHLKSVERRIRAAEAASGRADGSVALLAVSKTQPADAILAAYAAGQRAFGENYLQEALEKIRLLDRPGLEWHFIGRIQSNKTREIAENFHWVHSVCTQKQLRRLDDQRPPDMPPLNVCLQVNVSGEASKGGAAPEATAELVAYAAELPQIRLRGLMAIPEAVDEPARQRLPFRALRELRDRLARPGMSLDTLSMGMSGDLEAAIAEGATIVRIGTALFGPRDYVKS